jgi:uncharacterized protein
MENTAQFRFYEELNDFLPLKRKKLDFSFKFNGNPSIKDAIESLGVPHTEVDLILVNKVSVNFNYQLKNGDRVSVYPVFETLEVADVCRLRPKPLRELKFILDVHLGKLAKYLRLLGFDTLYANNYSDKDIVEVITKDSGRIVLTRDRGLLKRKIITHGYWVKSTEPSLQIKEVIARFDLALQVIPFTRCLACNSKIMPVEKSEIRDKLPDKVKECFETFNICINCRRIYWKGTHYDKMAAFIEQL